MMKSIILLIGFSLMSFFNAYVEAAAPEIKNDAAAIRTRREHSEQEVEEAMKKFLTWMNDEQKAELKKTFREGDRMAAYRKVMEFFEGTSGEAKTKASAELKAACKHYITELIGEEKAARIRHLKESGVTNEAISQEVDAIISLIPDEKKRVQAQHAAKDCKKIFGVATRMRREHHEHSLEEGFQKYLTWLTDGQKDELRKLNEKKDEDGIFKKILEYYEAATGEIKGKATEELKEGCKHHIVEYIGQEKADELKKLKDSGAPEAEIAKKVDEAIAAVADEKLKAKAMKAASGCRKIYGVTKARRHIAV